MTTTSNNASTAQFMMGNVQAYNYVPTGNNPAGFYGSNGQNWNI